MQSSFCYILIFHRYFLRSEEVPDITPIHPHIDLVDWNIYNDFALVPRNKFSLHLDTIMWSKERNQKYPWTRFYLPSNIF